MMLGATAGGAVRVAGGDGPLVVAEGIETALSLASGLLSRPATVWACLSTAGMAGLRLPAQEREKYGGRIRQRELATRAQEARNLWEQNKSRT